MKYRILGIISFLVIGLIIIYIITIPKEEKWTYNLPNDYSINKTSDIDVFLVKNKAKKIVNDYVAEFSYSENYITLKCLESNNNSIIVKFYIIDSLKDNIYGPYKLESEFKQELEIKVNEQLSNWIKTINVPDGAVISR